MDLNRLSEPQRTAVTTTEGAVLVLAGAGSGKTGVLTHRVAYLLSEMGVSPYSVLAITFTNKAAAEMRERIEKLVAADVKTMAISTFHSFCARCLRRCAQYIGYESGFSIYDTADSIDVIKKCAADMGAPTGKDNTARSVLSKISAAKNAMGRQSAEEYFEEHGSDILPLYEAYNRRLKAENAMDFDDLLLKFLEVLEKEPEVLSYYQKRFKYVMVDEFQDTNSVQYRLVRLISGKYGNLFVVGDDDQSIYSWRGADIRNILEFEKDYPGAAVIKLEQNYRSHQKILDAANAVIEKSEQRKQKTLWSARKEGALPVLCTLPRDYEEAEFVARTINAGVAEGAGYDSFAVLYRTHAQSRALEEKLRIYGVPYHVFGGMSFYERREVKDMIAYLTILNNPSSDTALIRVINSPKRGIGDMAVSRLRGAAADAGCSCMEVLIEGIGELPSRNKYAAFVDCYSAMSDAAEGMGVGETLEEIFEVSGYHDFLRRDEESEVRIQNVEELINAAYEYEKNAEEPSVSEFLGSIALFTDLDTMEDTGSVTLMTLHSAKGLEFDTVFIVGMEDSIFPSYRSIQEGNIEEERRLCYVGMTRAKQRLYLTNCESRNMYANTVTNLPSRFLRDIPPQMLNNMDRTKKQQRRAAEPKSRPAITFGVREAQIAPRPQHTSASGFKVGANVEHKKFGKGVILEMSGSGDSQIALIRFASGDKKMFLAFAPLAVK